MLVDRPRVEARRSFAPVDDEAEVDDVAIATSEVEAVRRLRHVADIDVGQGKGNADGDRAVGKIAEHVGNSDFKAGKAQILACHSQRRAFGEGEPANAKDRLGVVGLGRAGDGQDQGQNCEAHHQALGVDAQ